MSMTAEPTTAEILRLQDLRFAARTAHGMGALNRLIADDLRFVRSNGTAEDKAEFLRKLRGGSDLPPIERSTGDVVRRQRGEVGRWVGKGRTRRRRLCRSSDKRRCWSVI
jgi:hypothetical protein